ncbi:MAG: aminoacetone oxidase family FAD-binding enzyme [Lachnospiraceae bacterium]|nr:aminoacetone oxidase family FAD-binding enzyme [Lachnospiraceae bacterium]
MYDLCIIGGGMSAISCAVTAARRGLKVIILEKNDKLGKKIYATGNGRCNITNHNFSDNYARYYNSSSAGYEEFLKTLFKSDCPDKEVIEFLNSVGIITYDINSYVYPKSFQASSLMWTFNDELKVLNVEILFKSEIRRIDIIDDRFEITASNRRITASNVVLACGGASYKKLGGGMGGYELAKSLNIDCTDISPALCGLKTIEDVGAVSGVRTRAVARLYCGSSDNSSEKNICATEEGELQITDYGLSGIMIFNLSSKTGRILKSGERAFIKLDLIPNVEDKVIYDIFNNHPYRRDKALLNVFINDKLAEYVLRRLEKDNMSYDTVDMIKLLHNFSFEIDGLMDFENAQVTAGGIYLDEINPENMSLRRHPGMYAIGEMTDIDGICGGYNLTYAIITGKRVGESI